MRGDLPMALKCLPVLSLQIGRSLAQAMWALVYPAFYVDVNFNCTDCGCDEVWRAERQKWYYEVAKGWFPITPERCRGCREKIRSQKQLQREQMAKARLRRQGNNGP